MLPMVVWESYRKNPYLDFFLTSQREKYFVLSWFHHNPSTIHRNIRITRVNDLIRVVTLYAAVAASGSLTHLMGCGVYGTFCFKI
jgi:hypothetical protein